MVTYDGLRGEFFQMLEIPWVKKKKKKKKEKEIPWVKEHKNIVLL